MEFATAHPDATHEVTNQAPPLQPYNVFDADVALREALEREGGGWGTERLRDTGALAGSPEALEHSERCERNEPVLRTHDRYGNRSTRSTSTRPGTGCCARASSAASTPCPGRDPRPGAHTVRAGLMFLWGQVNAGVMCPVSMTHSVIPALREAPDLAEEWEPRLVANEYEPGVRGALAGMAMTEKQGGSDVRANTTRAERAGRRQLRDHRPQVVLLLPPVRRVPDARPDRRRAVVLPDRGARPRLPGPATQGQAGHALAALLGGRVPGRDRPAGRRGGPRRADHHPDGQPHPAGLPDRLRLGHALGHRAGHPPRPPPLRLRPHAGGPAGHDQRAGRPGRGVRGRHRHRHAHRPRLRRGRRRLPPGGHRGVQVLGVQARPAARQRGAGVPGRQRLRGGVGHAAAATATRR